MKRTRQPDWEAVAASMNAIAEPSRLLIVALLAQNPGGLFVFELQEPLDRSQPTVSHHVRKLVDTGLVQREEKGSSALLTLDLPAWMDVSSAIRGLNTKAS